MRHPWLDIFHAVLVILVALADLFRTLVILVALFRD